MDPEIKKANFKKICAELDVTKYMIKCVFQKVGISIEDEDQQAMANGDKEKLIAPFTRLERFLTKIAGKKIFEFEDVVQAPTSPIPTQKQSTGVKNTMER